MCVMCQVITEAAEAGEPLLFFCRVGKDRTGVLAALILACCGAKPEEIIADNHRERVPGFQKGENEERGHHRGGGE